MAIIKHRDGSSTKVIGKNIVDEMFKSNEIDKFIKGKGIEQVFISRTIITKTEQERAKLKDLCVKLRIDINPLDRKFIKHSVWIRENDIREAFRKLIILKTAFKR